MAEKEPIALAPYVYRRSTYFCDDKGRTYLVELTPTGIELTVIGMDMCFNHAADWSEGDLLAYMPEEDRQLTAEEQDEVCALLEGGLSTGEEADNFEDLELLDAPGAAADEDDWADVAFDETLCDDDDSWY